MADSPINGAARAGAKPTRRVEGAMSQRANRRRGAKSIALRSSGTDFA
jgi:hypothetical protein